MSNWAEPREKLLTIATELIRREHRYTVGGIAETMINCHYQGKSKRHALGQFRRDLSERVRLIRYNEWINSIANITDMAAVNNCGGAFTTYTEATRRAYNSEVRKWL